MTIFSRGATQLLTPEAMRRTCASAFAERPALDVSDRYTFVPTSNIVTALEPFGFFPVWAAEKRSNKEENRGFNKHMIRFTSKASLEVPASERFDLVLVNSHNRTSGFQFLAGVFRMVCSNGMILGDTVGGARCRHTGELSDIVDAAFTVVDSAPKVMRGVEVMKALPLTVGEQTAFAEAAREVLETEHKPEPAALLGMRRMADKGDDLWRVFNRVQENVIKGGVRLPPNRERRAVRTRGVNSVDSNVKLNKALWTLAAKMAELKGVEVAV